MNDVNSLAFVYCNDVAMLFWYTKRAIHANCLVIDVSTEMM